MATKHTDSIGMMKARLEQLKRDHKVVKAVFHGSYWAVFTADDVAHIWEDGTVTWEIDDV